MLGDGSIQIYNNHTNMWNVTARELYEAALTNMPVICPAEFSPLADVVCGMAGDMEEELVEELRMAQPRLYMLSNEKRTNGAATMLYPEIMERIYEEIGGNFYIIPSSIHEVILLPCYTSVNPGELKQLIMEVNRFQLEPEDILSDNLYYYNRREEKVKIV